MHKKRAIVSFISLVSVTILAMHPRYRCNIRATEYGYICVCNSTYCDTLDIAYPESSKEYTLVTTSRSKDRFHYKTGKFGDEDDCCKKKRHAYLEVDTSKTFQTMQGFGGAYTGAVTQVVSKLSTNMRKCFYKSYFSHAVGMGYSFIRIPLGGSDFDFAPWAYNEYPENDANLSNFTQLDPRDLLRNAQIRDLKAISRNNFIKLLAVSWGPPRWMKMKNEWQGGADNQLKPEYYQTWADYHLKWLQLMDNDCTKIWALSTGNEPASAAIIPFQALHWNASNQAKWIAEHLGPTIKNSKYAYIDLHGMDDNRDLAPAWIDEMDRADKRALEYLSGLEFHAYSDKALGPEILDEFQDRFPDKQIWYTEMCFGPYFMSAYPGPRQGTWGRAQKLTYILMENLSHSTVGYIDWNLMLNHKGGPTNFGLLDAPILVKKDYTEMYKQPIFYVMAHFSKFIPTGSIRIGTTLTGHGSRALRIVAFQRPDNRITVVIYNNAARKTVCLEVRDKLCGTVVIRIKPKSINTLIYAY